MVYRDMGQLDDAFAALRMALTVPDNTAVDRAAILHEMGTVAEGEEDWERAIGFYEEAAEADPTYRDVQNRIQELRSRGEG